MSDSSDFGDNAPVSDGQIERVLRHTVEKTYKSDQEQLTVRRLRTKVEQELGLDDGFFKGSAKWNVRSKDVIQSEVATQDAQSQPQSSQPAPVSSPAKERNQSNKDLEAVNGKKRRSKDNGGPAKRRKDNTSEEEISSADEVASSRQDVEKAGGRQSASSSPLSADDKEDEKGAAVEEAAEKATGDASGQGSESELSVLLDEEPKSKKRARKAGSEKSSFKKKKEGSKSAKAPQADPDSEEIKRLQGWLVKCGIRKMWFKELAPYNTLRGKIRHLKDMLIEVGMTGRYSQEKATQIREERELKADIEAVQAGAKQWGRGEPAEEDDGRPKRRVARGLQELDFLKDDDGEESD